MHNTVPPPPASPYSGPPAPPTTSAPVPTSQTRDTHWTEEDQKQKDLILEAIKNEENIHRFDYLFTRYILNAPPNDEDIKLDRVPGSGEVKHIPLNILLLKADETFASWGYLSGTFIESQKKNKAGQVIPFTICTVFIECVFPVTGTKRVFMGASNSNMTQSTAAEALLSGATKNALTKIGKNFGNRFIYAKLDRGYEDETSRAEQVFGSPETPPAQATPPDEAPKAAPPVQQPAPQSVPTMTPPPMPPV